jgi:hypothetical protein
MMVTMRRTNEESLADPSQASGLLNKVATEHK